MNRLFGTAVTLGAYVALGGKLQWSPQPGGGISTYRGGNFCGPGWGFTRADVTSGRIVALPAAIDAIDEACRLHDECYGRLGYFTQRCNLNLSKGLTAVILGRTSSPQQRVDAAIMAAVFLTEALTVDVGVGAYRDLRDSFERIWRDAFSMEAAIRAHLEGKSPW